MPNGLKSYPQTDVNGRNTGKELKNAANENFYAEYIYYRKVGDHGTNMPSSIYFGKNKNGAFAISDNVKYKYDKSGNISEVKENGVLTAKYTYDKIGRLVREDNRKLNKTNLWSYDVNGNILSKRETSFTLKPTDEIASFTDEKLYAYDGDKLLAFGDKTVFYDGYGRPTSYFGKALEWINGSRLKSFGDTQFAYDGYGRRIKKNDIVFTYDANNRLVKQTDGNKTLAFIYDNGGLSGVTYYDGVSTEDVEYIYCKDVQANIVGLLDKGGNVVVQYSYDAWGNHKVLNPDGTENADDNFIGNLNPFRYRSYYYDTETHLYYLNTRYYDPEHGRYISSASPEMLLGNASNVFALNLYALTTGNPVGIVMDCGSIEPSLDFYYNGEYKDWWEKYKNWVWLGAGVAATIAAVVAAPFTCGASGALVAVGSTLIKIAFDTAFGAAISLAIGGIIAGIQSEKTGHGFW